MKTTKRIKWVLLLTAILGLTACTSLKIASDGSGAYRNGLFQKQIGALEYSKSGTNVALKVTNLKSDAGAVIDALNVMERAYSGRAVPPKLSPSP
jgi:hypothetical protein